MSTVSELRVAARAALNANRAAEAEQAARRLTIEAPDADAWDMLSGALRALGRLDEALAASDEAMRLNPSAVHVVHNRAVALGRIGRLEEALSAYDGLVARGVVASALWANRGAALMGLGRDAEAEAVFADGVTRWPLDAGMHTGLANIRWMRGGGAAFTRDYEAVIDRQPLALDLRLGCADLLRRAGFDAKAEDLLRDGLKRMPDQPALLSLLGVTLTEAGRCAESLPLLRQAQALSSDAASVRAAIALTLLRLARPDEALGEIRPMRAAAPLAQEWICYESMAYRQLGDPRYHELCDYDLMVRAYDLTPPPGYRDAVAFNEALEASLNTLHVLGAHPLDQTLRHGSKTTRSLLSVKDPVIEAFFKALDEPIRAYTSLMQKPNHPWSGRKTGRHRVSGAWSNKLWADGYHVNHLHPEGWISSAYYVALPHVMKDGAGQEGWIKFGEPRWPTPGCGIEKVIQPQVGRLVLFPSYMWHGTIPFSEGERLTAPFDVVPV